MTATILDTLPPSDPWRHPNPGFGTFRDGSDVTFVPDDEDEWDRERLLLDINNVHVSASNLHYYYLSYGPDSDHDFEHEEAGGGHEHEHGEGSGAIYDATNGTLSSGDIYYVGPGTGFL